MVSNLPEFFAHSTETWLKVSGNTVVKVCADTFDTCVIRVSHEGGHKTLFPVAAAVLLSNCYGFTG